MTGQELCQALLDHVVVELPHERDAALSLAAMVTFHPEEIGFFVSEAVLLLIRNGRPVPAHLLDEVNQRMLAGTARP
jgi:hypothetical protein